MGRQHFIMERNMKPLTSLKNRLLIAIPTLKDRNFSKTVVYLSQIDQDGAYGIVINKPSQATLSQVCERLKLPEPIPSVAQELVYKGGPVAREHGFILYPSDETPDGLILSNALSMLESIAQGHGPKQFIVAIGYAGWGPGQLEAEIQRNDWVVAPAGHDVIFDTPVTSRWEAAAAQFGLDIKQLSSQVGHA